MELWEHMGTCAGDLHMMGGFGLWFFLFSMTKPNIGFWFDSRPWIRWCWVLEIWLNPSLMKSLWGFSSCNKKIENGWRAGDWIFPRMDCIK
jgi:hypothetical protein